MRGSGDCLARHREVAVEVRLLLGARENLVAEDDVGEAPRRIDQHRRHVRRDDRAVAQDRHQRHDAGAAADQQERPAVGGLPGEMAADRPAHLDRVADLHDLVEERRHLAGVEFLDDQFDVFGLRRRADRIAALRLVAVGRREPHVDVLAGAEAAPVGRLQEEALDRRRLVDDAADFRLLPDEAFGG